MGAVSMEKTRDNEINKILEAEEKLIMDIDNLIRQKSNDILKDYNFQDMTDTDEEKYESQLAQRNELEEKLKMSLTEGQREIVREMDELRVDIASMELDYMFRRGMLAGWIELRNLREKYLKWH